MNRSLALCLAMGWTGYLVLPWYAIEDGFWSLSWLLDGYPDDSDYAPALFQVLLHGKTWLAPVALALLAPIVVLNRARTNRSFAVVLIASGAVGVPEAIEAGRR